MRRDCLSVSECVSVLENEPVHGILGDYERADQVLGQDLSPLLVDWMPAHPPSAHLPACLLARPLSCLLACLSACPPARTHAGLSFFLLDWLSGCRPAYLPAWLVGWLDVWLAVWLVGWLTR